MMVGWIEMSLYTILKGVFRKPTAPSVSPAWQKAYLGFAVINLLTRYDESSPHPTGVGPGATQGEVLPRPPLLK
jgi:hypothetical protein